MRICTLASSSSGNCTVVSYNDTHLLIDAGISLRRIKDCLHMINLTPGDIGAILITHAHTDHISGIKMLLKHHKTPVFSSVGAGNDICSAIPEAEPYINCFETGAGFELGGITVRSFTTQHDAPGSVGYTLHANGKKLAYATDLGRVTDEVLQAACGANAAVIEANHDRNMLHNGPYPFHLKKRILSERGHLANNECGSFAARLALSGSQYILLAHLSRENNTPKLARDTVANALRKEGLSVNKDVELDVAPPDIMGAAYAL